MGIEPHFDLFLYLFLLRPHPSKSKIAEIGGAEISLRPGKEREYIFYQPTNLNVEWKNSWFYVGNHQPSLLEQVPGLHKVCNEWSDAGPGSQQVKELIKKILALKDAVTSGSVVYS